MPRPTCGSRSRRSALPTSAAGNLHALARAGLVAEQRPGAAGDLWRALRTDVAPTGAVGF